MASRTCSECGASLSGLGPRAKTCSTKCRSTRSRRIKRGKDEERDYAETRPAAHQEIRSAIRRESPDVINRVLRDELQPIVREAITEDVLRAIQQLVGLTPRAVQLLEADMEDDDPTTRQRAYTLLLKYTTGHPALVQPKDTEAGKQITVNFALPRPEQEAIQAANGPITAEAIELRTCDSCGEDKPSDEFVTNSQRCQVCFEMWHADVESRYLSRT